jgi:hypothetical protein
MRGTRDQWTVQVLTLGESAHELALGALRPSISAFFPALDMSIWRARWISIWPIWERSYGARKPRRRPPACACYCLTRRAAGAAPTLAHATLSRPISTWLNRVERFFATLYSLTAEGERAIRAADAAATEPSVPTVATPRTASPSASVYQGAELRPYTGRAGALDSFAHPSRMGDRLHHRNGSLTPVV